ncbi:MAG: OmpA family protein, partial [Nitrospirae bacterium]
VVTPEVKTEAQARGQNAVGPSEVKKKARLSEGQARKEVLAKAEQKEIREAGVEGREVKARPEEAQEQAVAPVTTPERTALSEEAKVGREILGSSIEQKEEAAHKRASQQAVTEGPEVSSPVKEKPVVPSGCKDLVSLKKTGPEKFLCETELYFDYNRFVLDVEALKKLKCVLDILKDVEITHLYIEGHSCAHGPETYNLALSEKRANRVKRYLRKKLHLSDNIIEVKAYGEFKLKFPEIPTRENRYDPEVRMNRRVVLRIEFIRQKDHSSTR